MNLKIVIRSETNADVNATSEVTVAAFKALEISNHTEQFIITMLRAANALAVSLVAEADGRVVGHIAFSPVIISGGTPSWYGLGPVSVLPEYQRQGIGKALIQEGLSRLKDMVLKDVASLDIRITTQNSGSKISQAWCLREFLRRCSSLCLSMDILRKVPLFSMMDSRQLTNIPLQRDAPPASRLRVPELAR